MSLFGIMEVGSWLKVGMNTVGLQSWGSKSNRTIFTVALRLNAGIWCPLDGPAVCIPLMKLTFTYDTF